MASYRGSYERSYGGSDKRIIRKLISEMTGKVTEILGYKRGNKKVMREVTKRL